METLFEIGLQSWGLFWLPTFVWTGIMLGLLLVLKAVPTKWPQIHLDLRLAALFALVLGTLSAWLVQALPEQAVPVLLVPNPLPIGVSAAAPVDALLPAEPNLFTWWHILGVVTVCAVIASIIGIYRLLTGWIQLHRVLDEAQFLDAVPYRLPEGAERIEFRTSSQCQIPFSAGLSRKWIVLPESMPESDRRTVLMHELNHHLNGDIARAWLSHVARALFYFHPLVHVVHRKCLLLTEIVCDRRILDNESIEARSYAALLLRSTPSSTKTGPILALAHSPSQLRKRISAMKKRVSLPFSRFQLLNLGFLSAFLMIVVIGCSEFEVSPTEADVTTDAYDLVMELPAIEASKAGEVFVVVEQTPVLLGGLAGIQNEIQYPEIAKRAGIQGRVFLQFIVETDGSVRDAQITRGIGGGCDEEALRAVSTAKFVPGVQDGVRVPVKMSIPVTFRLGEDGEPADYEAPTRTRPTQKDNLQDLPNRPVFARLIDADISYERTVMVMGTAGQAESLESVQLAAKTIGAVAIVKGGVQNTGTLEGEPNADKILDNNSWILLLPKKE